MKIKILIVLLIPFLGFGQIINHNNNDFKICNDGNFIIVGTESIEDHQLGTKKTNGYIIKTNKDASRTKVIEAYPEISNELSRKKDSNKADAILIARYFNDTQL